MIESLLDASIIIQNELISATKRIKRKKSTPKTVNFCSACGAFLSPETGEISAENKPHEEKMADFNR